MATEFLRHQNSIACYDNKFSGCMRGLFKFLDMHKHMHKRRVGAKFLASGQNGFSADQELLLEKEASSQMENKIHKKKKRSGTSQILNLIYKKMVKKKDRKLKISSSSHLLRTLSIHHLECNNYVFPDDSISDTDSSTIDLSSHSSDLSSDKQLALSPKRIRGPTFDKQRIKDVIEENLKKERLITLDGVLDKIPIDQKLSGNGQRDKKSRFGSEGFVNINSKIAHRTIQRSRSLTESLDRYSILLEDQRLPRRSNSVKEQDKESINRNARRSLSLSESFDIYSRLLESVSVKDHPKLHRRLNSINEQDTSYARGRNLWSRSLSESFDVYSHLLESVSVVEHKKRPERLKSVKEETFISSDAIHEVPSQLEKLETKFSTMEEPDPVGVILNTEENMDVEKIVDQNVIGSLDQPEFIIEHNQNEISVINDAQNVIMGSLDQPELIIEHNQNEISDAQLEFAIEIKDGQNDKSIKPSPISLLDSSFDEDPVSPVKYTDEEGAEAQFSWISFEEHDGSKLAELVETTYNGDINSTHAKEDYEFSYVKNVLKKSGFCGGADEFLSAWYSSNEPVDRLLFIDELEAAKDENSIDIQLDQQLLLLDLINEVLLEIYESTIACSTGLSRFSRRSKPLLVGEYFIEEVWSKISWHFSLQNNVSNSLEYVESRDFAKGDGWMNLLFDIERVGTEMEGLILDELVDEIVADFRCV